MTEFDARRRTEEDSADTSVDSVSRIKSSDGSRIPPTVNTSPSEQDKTDCDPDRLTTALGIVAGLGAAALITRIIHKRFPSF